MSSSEEKDNTDPRRTRFRTPEEHKGPRPQSLCPEPEAHLPSNHEAIDHREDGAKGESDDKTGTEYSSLDKVAYEDIIREYTRRFERYARQSGKVAEVERLYHQLQRKLENNEINMKEYTIELHRLLLQTFPDDGGSSYDHILNANRGFVHSLAERSLKSYLHSTGLPNDVAIVAWAENLSKIALDASKNTGEDETKEECLKIISESKGHVDLFGRLQLSRNLVYNTLNITARLREGAT